MASAISGTSSLYQSTVGTEVSHMYRESIEIRLKQWRKWLAGKNYEGNRVYMGRTLLQWLMYLGTYLLFFLALIIIFVIFMALFFWAIDWNTPELQGAHSIMQSPGLSFRPQHYIGTTLIRFSKGSEASWVPLNDHLEAFLKNYENKNQQGDFYVDCNDEAERRKVDDVNKACRFDLNDLGQDCVKQQQFGLSNGQPCVLLKLNKIFDWVPEEYTNETVPDIIRPQWEKNKWTIFVTCEGETPFDRENMGVISYIPDYGFPFKYYPFRNQQGFRSPLMFVRFETPASGVLLMITCKAWARNIRHDTNEMVGMTHFEMIVD